MSSEGAVHITVDSLKQQRKQFRSNAALCYKAGKVFKRAVIGAFCIGRKRTCRQFSAAQMISQTIATDALSRTRFITAVTDFFIVCLFAFHSAILNKTFIFIVNGISIFTFGCFSQHEKCGLGPDS